MSRTIKRIFTATLLALPLFVSAHEGHSHFHANDIRHYWLTEHMLPIALMAGVLAFVLFQIVRLVIKSAKEKAA